MGPHFKNTVRAAVFCIGLLAAVSILLFHASAEKVDPLVALLELPAPPPPNPLIPHISGVHDETFFRADNPPPDNAPIDDIIDYWTRQTDNRNTAIGRRVTPSERVLDRLFNEMRVRPAIATKVLAILPENNRDAAEAVKTAYERLTAKAEADDTETGVAAELKEWLKYNSPYFASDLQAAAAQAKDTSSHYIDGSSENSVLALTRYDWEHASPIVGQLYGDKTEPVTQAVATWALYRHALDTDSSSDAERYRSELMRMVEDKSLPDGVRDKANDALMKEKDFPGREEWAISLFEDETLVNMPQYTMITTLMLSSPSDKFVPRLIEVLEKNNKPIVRAAVVRNLILALGPTSGDSDLERQIVKAMLPWLEDPKWADDARDDRASIIRHLVEMKMPEAVPGLIKVLEEKRTVPVSVYGSNSSLTTANMAANRPYSRASNAANVVAMGASAAAVANAAAGVTYNPTEQYPYRSEAMQALGKQRDQRAVPALRRALNAVPDYERQSAVQAIFLCNGFSVQEQLNAVDTTVEAIREQQTLGAANLAANGVTDYSGNTSQEMALAAIDMPRGKRDSPPSPYEVRTLLGQVLMGAEDGVSDELARGVVDRISDLDKRDPSLSAAYRAFVMKWRNGPVNLLFLRDLKQGKASSEVMVRLLATRKELLQAQRGDVFDLRTGVPRAVGLAACMLEDKADYDTILDTGQPDAKVALLACGRLIRAPFDVQKVVPLLDAKEPLLARAAELYLISEDSPAARSAVLAKHPGEAMLLGARSEFGGTSEEGYSDPGPWLTALFSSSGSYSIYYGWGDTANEGELGKIEDELRSEVKKDDSLVGVYAFDKNYVRIYRDRVIYSWDDDDSRYYERPMTSDEFDYIRAYLESKRADELPPFIYCGGGYCTSRELVMLGRNGGRRVYIAGEPDSPQDDDFFIGLQRYFENMKKAPATLKYSLSREVPGLEIALADDDLEAKAVWKNGDDLRVAVCSKAVRTKIDKEIEKAAPVNEPATQGTAPDELNEANIYKRHEKLTEQREYEGCSWQHVSAGKATGYAIQPPDVEYIPIRDGMPAQPTQEQWKARIGGAEIRADSAGLFSIARGQASLVAKGDFSYPVATPGGRWLLAVQGDNEESDRVVRVDLLTRKVHAISAEELPDIMRPVAYIPSINRVLLIHRADYAYEEDLGGVDANDVPYDVDPTSMYLVDPATGSLTDPNGEFRPLAQQTFRSLQRTSAGSSYWAALPDNDKRSTTVGVYDAGKFTFKPVLTVPKIVFNSMGMWVDEPAQKIFFVYRGHLLSLPFTSELPQAAAPRAVPPKPRKAHH